MKKTMVQGYLYAVLSAVIFGCMPLMATHIYEQGMTPMALVFWRNLLALPAMALLAYRERRTLKVPPQALPTMVLLSFFGCTITPILLFSSYRYIASGTATVFHFVYPAAVVLVGLVFLRKKVHGTELLSVALCMVGVMLFYEPGADINLAGSAMALGSGVLFAIYIVMLDVFRWRQEVCGYLLSFYIAAFSALMTGLLCAVTGDFALPAGLGGWGLCLLFALLMTVLAMSMFQQAALLIGGEKTSVLSTLEPITSIVVGVLAFRERVGAGALLGSVLVIAASVLIALSDLKRAKEAR